MSDKDDGIAVSIKRDFGMEKAGIITSVVLKMAAAIMLVLSYFIPQGLAECRDPSGCTETQVATYSLSDGTPTITGWLLIAGLILLVVGVILLAVLRMRMKRTPDR